MPLDQQNIDRCKKAATEAVHAQLLAWHFSPTSRSAFVNLCMNNALGSVHMLADLLATSNSLRPLEALTGPRTLQPFAIESDTAKEILLAYHGYSPTAGTHQIDPATLPRAFAATATTTPTELEHAITAQLTALAAKAAVATAKRSVSVTSR